MSDKRSRADSIPKPLIDKMLELFVSVTYTFEIQNICIIRLL